MDFGQCSVTETAGASFEKLVDAAERLGANQGRTDVVALYKDWIAAQPPGAAHLYAAWFNLGAELSLAGDAANAMSAYRMALVQQPGFAPAAINLGLLLERGGDAQAALATWQSATQSDDARTSLLNHQARLLERNGHLQAAEARLRASLLTTPMQPDVIQHWIHVRQKMCAWPVIDSQGAGIPADTLIDHCGPLAALALFDDVAVQTRISAGWIGRKTVPVAERLSPAEGYRHEKIRIGYLSSDFCRHAMSFLVAELFERHDRERFEVYGYCSTIEDGSDIRRRVTGAFDHCRTIRDLPDEQAAHVIARDEIDILVDLNGLTQGSRLQVLRWRPAPVQATYLGFIGPVPLPELDYMFCDDFVVPPRTAGSYRPAPLYIAPNYQANDSKREIGVPNTRVEAGLPATGFVFCCFSNHYKITQEMFASWMAILHRTDDSWLWLIADNEWSCRNLRLQAGRYGIDPDRLLFAGRVSPSDYMSRLAVADLFLDTFPYNAGTIASDAIRMGLPLVTRLGEAFASRMAARLLSAVGADAGIARDADDYVSTAVTLANDPTAYARYKAFFTPTNWTATIGDIGQLTRSLESMLARIVKRRGTAERTAPATTQPAPDAPAPISPAPRPQGRAPSRPRPASATR